ncbi:MAG: ParA family protein [Chordicoccus sp.]
MGKPVTISFAARKGGVGKSFLAANTAAFLICDGYRVLCVGIDQQDDLADRYLIDTDYDPHDHNSLADVLAGKCTPREAIYQTYPFPAYRWRRTKFRTVVRDKVKDKTVHMDIMPAGNAIVDVTARSPEQPDDGYDYDLITEKLEPVFDDYDFIIFDCPPSDYDGSILAYAASDYIITPYHGIDSSNSVDMMVETLRILAAPKANGAKQYKPEYYLVMSMHNPRATYDAQGESFVREDFGDHVFKQTIRKSQAAENAKVEGTPLAFNRKADISEDVYLFEQELLDIVRKGEEK